MAFDAVQSKCRRQPRRLIRRQRLTYKARQQHRYKRSHKVFHDPPAIILGLAGTVPKVYRAFPLGRAVSFFPSLQADVVLAQAAGIFFCGGKS